MLWFFDRAEERLQIETLYDNAANEFVAIVRWPDGRAQTERFADMETFRRWLLSLEQALEFARWKSKSPMVLPYGWPNSRLM